MWPNNPSERSRWTDRARTIHGLSGGFPMNINPNRRSAIMTLGLSVAAGGLAAGAAVAVAEPNRAPDLMPSGAGTLKALAERIARAPRRRDFRSVPMILEDPMLW